MGGASTLFERVASSVTSARFADASSAHTHSQCTPEHDVWALGLGIFLCVGLVISYLPQILRIILKKSSLGFSPWFLLLGATSSASSFLNVVTLQWGTIQCCTKITTGQCLESLVGVFQVGMQWLLFISVLALFLIYYPVERRYERSIALPKRNRLSSFVGGSSRGVSLGGDGRGNEDEEEDDDDDDSSIGDIDSVGSHIANNYSTFANTRGSDAAVSEAGEPHVRVTASDSPDSSALASRFAGVRDNTPASSSAFDRLVPTFWPMWRASAQGRTAPSPGSGQSSSHVEHVGGTQSADAGARRPSGGAVQDRRSSRSALLGAPKGLKHKRRRVKHKTEEWGLAQALAWVVAIHFLFIVLVTMLLVSTLPVSAFPPPQQPPLPVPPVTDPAHSRGMFHIFGNPASRLLVNRWAAFLGITGTLLAAAQYVPQIAHTARTKTVGSLSIPMMCLQVPGSAIFVYSLALRPGIDWTSLAAYVCTGFLQLALLILCICWSVRQKRLGIDDYGNPVQTPAEPFLRRQQVDYDDE
ncbi:unnamed protein product [Parajaminaea phylloscopi]